MICWRSEMVTTFQTMAWKPKRASMTPTTSGSRERDHARAYGLDQEPYPHRRARAEPPGEAFCREASRDPADGYGGEQHAVTDRAQSQPLLGEEHEDQIVAVLVRFMIPSETARVRNS